MSLKHYFIALGIGIALALLSLMVVIMRVNPENNPLWGPVLFYMSLFLTVVGIYATGGFVWRVKVVRQNDVLFRQVKKTFRQGCLFGGVVVFSLVLQHAHLLRWWSIILIIAAALGVELRSLLYEERVHASHRSPASLR